MSNVEGNNVPESDTVSLSSTRTLVDQDDAGSDPSYEKVEKVPAVDGHQDVVTSDVRQVDDAEMADGNQTADVHAPFESVQEVNEEPSSVNKAGDVPMTDAEAHESIDQTVLNALEHQKRSSGTDQQDVEEVMGSIINRLQAAIRPSSVDQKTGIQLEKLMETFFVTTVNYTKKFHETNYQHEISFDRAITAYPAEEGQCSLYDALGRNFDQQILEDSRLSRYTAIKTLPPILHVLIQRTTSKGSKNGNPVVIPETLYLDRYMDMGHDSPAFRHRVEDWITAKRIADIKAQLDKIEPNPTYMRSLESYSSATPEPLEQPGSVAEDDAINIEVETWDFDGPVEDDFLLVSSKKTPTQQTRQLPKVDGIYETHVRIKEMMEQELKGHERIIEAHHETLKQIPYRLHAVICHRGQLMSGHYWVWIHDFEENVWRWYNDADVKENKDTAEVLQTLSSSGEPYFLCYVRDEDKNKFVDVPKRQPPPPPEPEPEAEPATQTAVGPAADSTEPATAQDSTATQTTGAMDAVEEHSEAKNEDTEDIIEL
jgi:ubiquitin carboxyl-terminal hydrolase 25/28